MENVTIDKYSSFLRCDFRGAINLTKEQETFLRSKGAVLNEEDMEQLEEFKAMKEKMEAENKAMEEQIKKFKEQIRKNKDEIGNSRFSKYLL